MRMRLCIHTDIHVATLRKVASESLCSERVDTMGRQCRSLIQQAWQPLRARAYNVQIIVDTGVLYMSQGGNKRVQSRQPQPLTSQRELS